MPASRTSITRFLAILLIALAPLKAVAEDVKIGDVPVPAGVKTGEGDSPFLGAWFGAWGDSWRMA